MIRKLLLPALAAAVLGGCVTGYDYRGGNGDYYYGQPSVDYDGGYYGGYGYPGGWSGMMGFGYGYGGYGGYGYGYPYYGYGYPYYPPVIIVRPDRPGAGTGPHRPGQRPPDIQAVPSPLHGRGHPLAPSSLSPAGGGQRPIPMPREAPTPHPRQLMLLEPRQPILHEVRENPRVERDRSLKLNP